MRTSTSLLLAATLAVVACGDDDSKPTQEDSGIPSGEVKDASTRDAVVPSVDAGAPLDARASEPDGSLAVEDATVALDASVEEDAATPVEPDATVTPDPDAAITLDPDAAIPGEPDAEVPVEPDAGTPPPVCDPSAPVVGRLGLQTVFSGGGLSYLTEAHQPPDSEDWYLVQQNGIIRVLQNGALRPTPFLDVSAEIAISGFGYEDRGLVSIEFAPDYATSGRFYVALTPNRGTERNLDQVRSYLRSAVDPYFADPSTRQDVLSIRGSRVDALDDSITNIHNGGRITFGPDGMLYVAMGDGGGIRCGDTEPNATQDINSLFGKLLRLDLSKPAPYAADDNPFVQGGDPRVLHYGLRNPFRYSFDRLNGDLYLGDVGQNTYEEVSFAPAGSKGLNFGWAHFEGPSNETCGALRPLRPGSTHTPPIYSINRGIGANGPFADYNAMIGGVVYRGTALPQLQGTYFFGGYRGARMGALRQCSSTTSPVTPVTKACNANTPNEACFRALNGSAALNELRAIVEDHAGEMYFVANGNTLYKVVPLP